MRVGYSDFVKLCRVESPEGWTDWLSVRSDGVYVKIPPDGLTVAERSGLTEHPTGNLEDPALPFPCTLKDLQSFLEEQGVYGCIDAFDMVDWISAKNKFATPKNVGQRSERSFLHIIGALLEWINGSIPNVDKHPSFINESNLIERIDAHFKGLGGLSHSHLSRTFPKAKKALREG